MSNTSIYEMRFTNQTYEFGFDSGETYHQIDIAYIGQYLTEEYAHQEMWWAINDYRQKEFFEYVRDHVPCPASVKFIETVSHWVGLFIDEYHDREAFMRKAILRDWADWMEFAYDMIVDV